MEFALVITYIKVSDDGGKREMVNVEGRSIISQLGNCSSRRSSSCGSDGTMQVLSSRFTSS